MMPIRDWSKYPLNWKSEIRPAILARANNCCEECGIENYSVGYRDAEGKFYDSKLIFDALEDNGYDYFSHELSNCYDKKGNPSSPIKIVLTISHLNHDVTNNDYSNLKAMCQRCHLLLDKDLHRENSRATNEKKKGLQKLF